MNKPKFKVGDLVVFRHLSWGDVERDVEGYIEYILIGPAFIYRVEYGQLSNRYVFVDEDELRLAHPVRDYWAIMGAPKK